MRTVLSTTVLSALLAAVSCTRAADDYSPEDIIALERGALDRWGKGDPQGFLDLMAEDETYFDPLTEKRIDGREALRQYMAPFAGKIRIDRVELIDPQVRRQGDLAVLTFNLANYGAQFDGGPKSTSRWNATEVFQRIDGRWKIVHSHWSYTKPELKTGGQT
jgi:uncharacterized protein (TIGR02246 family)